MSGGKWVYPHGDAATRVRDAVNAELKSRGMEPDARIFCELLNVEDESWQDCVEACLGDRRFDILVPPAHYAAAKSAFVALKDKVGPISLLDTPGILWPRFDSQEVGELLAITGAIKAEVLDRETLAANFMLRLAKFYPDAVEQRYKFRPDPACNGFELLEQAAKKRGFLISGGEYDLERMAGVLLDEYRGGKLGRITLEMPEADV